MAGLPSLALLDAEAVGELAAQQRHSDALDTKAGVVLGFAGVLVPLSLASLHGVLAHVGAAVAALAAILAGAGFLPRSFPTLSPVAMRAYLTAEEEFTRRRLLDTRIAIYIQTRTVLVRKARLVTLATISLGAAVILTVVAGIVGK